MAAKGRRRRNGRRRRATIAAAGAAAIVAGSVLLGGVSGALADDPNIDPMDPIVHRGDRFIPKPAGTKEDMKFYFGPYVVPPGWDANRFDLDVPISRGMVVSIEPGMRRAEDGTEPSHQEGHIHHAHWFSFKPGSHTDNYFSGFAEWQFGNGDEETKADFQERSDADPNGPIYGDYVGPEGPGPVIYMLHNKTAETMVVYIMLEVTFIHGSLQELNAMSDRPYHNVSGVLFGRTYDVPRDPKSKDGTFETPEDDPKGVIQWRSPVSGTMIGTGSHLHPGGLRVITENYGSEENPCPDTGDGYGGTVLLKSDALWRKDIHFSEDFQMEVTHPAWRAPIHEGDRIRISGLYENQDHAWYDVMTHQGIYIDQAQPPQGRCKPYLVGPAAKAAKKAKRKAASKRALRRGRKGATGRKAQVLLDPAEGVPNRSWGHHPTDTYCGKRYGAGPCERKDRPRGPGIPTNDVQIANFQYQPGDRSLSGQMGAPPVVQEGTSLRFENIDQVLNIRHSVTTCRWPCNGPYVANYPLPDGVWDSGTLGYDVIDGGSPNPVSMTPPDLDPGKYSYFCRIHPWMRGAFEVKSSSAMR